MNDRRLRFLRIAFVVVIVLSSGVLAAGYLTAPIKSTTETGQFFSENDVTGDVTNAQEITVVGSQHSLSGGTLAAFDGDGDLVYYNDSLDSYWDIDPVDTQPYTVEYIASNKLPEKQCVGTTGCRQIIIQRENLATGETTRVYSTTVPWRKHGMFTDHTVRWHDVDRINSTHVVVADIAEDRVFILNTTSGHITWEWQATSSLPKEGGGPYPYDWTHLNDVELVKNGTQIMVDLRNQDKIIFLDRTTGTVVENWTLGADDEHSILYEQHNPDYIPKERGGPALLVADSENNRIVEYQRRNGSWAQSWVWQDDALQWPRDADRLPNGHTLITDSHGDRVLEVNQQGEIVWSVKVQYPYEAERLGTDDESAGGHSAAQLGLANRGDGSTTGAEETTSSGIGNAIKSLFPNKLVNALQFITPVWMGVLEFGALLALGGSLLGLGATALYERLAVSISSPVSVRRK